VEEPLAVADAPPGAADQDGADEARPATGTATAVPSAALDEARRKLEKRTERQMWWYLAYFLFAIHFVALVLIFAVRHAK
jgi:hypothetical protein